MTKRMKLGLPLEQEEEIEQAAAEQAEFPAERVFDFTGPVEGFDVESQRIYYLLRRAAILAANEGALPDGKQYSKAQVVEILGADYEKSLVADTKCCG